MDDRNPYGDVRRRGFGSALLALVLAFVLGIVLAAAAVHRWDRVAQWLHPPAVTPVAPRPVERVVVQPLPLASSSSGYAALAERVEGIEQRIDGIEAQSTAASGNADRAEALVVAVAIRRALDRGQPLGYLEGLLRQRFGGSDAPAVAMLIASAQRPVTLIQLQNMLETLAPAITTVAPGESWWSGVRRELASLVIVRRADTPSSAPDARLERARHALDQGQVDVAAAEVARMPGAPSASGWLASARRYLLARNALDRIETAALLKPAASAPAPAAAPLLD